MKEKIDKIINDAKIKTNEYYEIERQLTAAHNQKMNDIRSLRNQVLTDMVNNIIDVIDFPFQVQDVVFISQFDDEREGKYSVGDEIRVHLVSFNEKTLVEPYDYTYIVFYAWCTNLSKEIQFIDGEKRNEQWGGQLVSFDKDGNIRSIFSPNHELLFKRKI